MKTQRWVLVTGAGRRLGQDMAVHLASLGWGVAVHYHASQEGARETFTRIQGAGGTCALFSCDLSDAEAAAALIPDILKTGVPLEAVINNASIFEPAGLRDGAPVLLERHWRINVEAPYILTRQFALLCQRGQIINILDTSITGHRITHLPYLMTKKALAALTELAAVDLGPEIRVNAVAPGCILPPEGAGAGFVEQRVTRIPLKQKGTPRQVSEAVQFLLEHSYITGQTLFVDGGEHVQT